MRAAFPRGLAQPRGSFRFSLDALLLASFLLPARGERVLDLGSGCGVVALGMLCRCPDMRAVGLEKQPELLAAATRNSARLGFAGSMTVLRGDVFCREDLEALREGFDTVLANPPYRQRHQGRLPASPLRLTALFEEPGSLSAFCLAAAYALRPDGRFGCVFPADREEDLLHALEEAGLSPLRVLPVRARLEKPPLRVLVEARKTPEPQGPPLREAPLTLHSGTGEHTKLTEEALRFCSFLR